jgi:hypothetical protein
MLFSTTIFPNLDDALRKANISRRDLSIKSQINYDTLGNKLRGDTEFTRPEMYRIKEVINQKIETKIFLDELFTTSNYTQDTA